MCVESRHQCCIWLHVETHGGKQGQFIFYCHSTFHCTQQSRLAENHYFQLLRTNQRSIYLLKWYPGDHFIVCIWYWGKNFGLESFIQFFINKVPTTKPVFKDECNEWAIDLQWQFWQFQGLQILWTGDWYCVFTVLLGIKLLPQDDWPLNNSVHPADLLCEISVA